MNLEKDYVQALKVELFQLHESLKVIDETELNELREFIFEHKRYDLMKSFNDILGAIDFPKNKLDRIIKGFNLELHKPDINPLNR